MESNSKPRITMRTKKVAWFLTPVSFKYALGYDTYTGKKSRRGYSRITGKKGNFFWGKRKSSHRH